MGHLLRSIDTERHVVAEGYAGYLACTGTCDLDGTSAIRAEVYWEASINVKQPFMS